MRSNRLPLTTVISSLGFALLAGACVPKAPTQAGSTGAGGGRPPVAALEQCKTVDEDVTANPGASGTTPMSCSGVTTCFPYVRPYTKEQNDYDVAQALDLMKNMGNGQMASHLRGTVPGQYNDIERTQHDAMNFPTYQDTGGVRELKFRDASRGLNFAVEYHGDAWATAFPVSMARGASFDLDLEYRVGMAEGDEMVASGNTMLLAPCMNILRHPLWGRAQETYGEDSFHLGRMATALTIGIQEYVAACAKHYLGNNVENGRRFMDATMDEQTLREVYGRHFEMVIRDGGLASVMASYNRVNGTYQTENKHTLTDVLRGPASSGGFEFKGFVLSDWWAFSNHDSLPPPMPDQQLANTGIQAGLDMELGWNLNYSTLEDSVMNNLLPLQSLQTATERVLAQKSRFNGTKPGDVVGLRPAQTKYTGFNAAEHAHSIIKNNEKDPEQGQSHVALAQEAAVKSMVLLKNDSNTLPIKRASVQKVAVLGRAFYYVPDGVSPGSNDQFGDWVNGTFLPKVDFAKQPRVGDIGSSRVFFDPSLGSGPFQGIQEAAGGSITVKSYDSVSAMTSDGFSPDVIVVVAGLTPMDEGEEYTNAGDRKSFDLDAKKPAGQIQLVADAVGTGKPTVLVLEGASVMTIPSLDQLKAVVMAFYPGMDGGRALGKLLFGDANFSGKLPFSWPRKLDDLPTFVDTPNGDKQMDYYLGYRYYDNLKKVQGSSAPTPLFAYGHGMSYTTYEYSNLQIPCATVDENSIMDITVEVKNAGLVDGDEVVFLFASFPNSAGRRSVKELKAFRKVAIKAGKTMRVHIPLRIADLKYFQTDAPADTATTGHFVVEKGANGTVNIQVGSSSDTLPLTGSFQVN